MAKVEVAKAKIGKGLFASQDIKKDEIIFVAKGIVKKDDYGPDYEEGPNWLTLKKGVWLSPFENNSWRFINHSCNPNAGMKGKVTVVAMKNIKKGEEVTLDYSITEEDPYWQMACNCREKNCRKIIRSVQFLPKNLFEKYKNYMPHYLKKSYIDINNKINFK